MIVYRYLQYAWSTTIFLVTIATSEKLNRLQCVLSLLTNEKGS